MTGYGWDEEAPFEDYPTLKLASVEDRRIREAEWLWTDRLPIGAVSILAGRGGIGKSTLAAHIAAKATRGTLPGTWEAQPMTAVMIGAEDDLETTLLPRLLAAGADKSRVRVLEMPTLGGMFAVDANLIELAEQLDVLADQGHSVGLIVIDPLDAHLGRRVDTHRKAEVQAAVMKLAQLAQAYRCAVLGLGHLNKGESRYVAERLIGSVGFSTGVRSMLFNEVHPDDADERICALSKANYTDKSKVDALRFRIDQTVVDDDGTSVHTSKVIELGYEHIDDPDSLLNVPDGNERTERGEATDWLAEYLADGAKQSRDVKRDAKAEGIAESTLHRARKSLGVVIDRDHHGGGNRSTWRLPTDEDAHTDVGRGGAEERTIEFVPPPDSPEVAQTPPTSRSRPDQGVSVGAGVRASQRVSRRGTDPGTSAREQRLLGPTPKYPGADDEDGV